ncbi:precorrin-6A synthase (deacetylating) [Aquabacter sediminis]|uniref:precorrin-6A synthase (deacetylating) n=1 Tax=Aquabacter sediminis TaxID=3029197 RepID=UPI00237E9BEB|nr:precorrin-6A synthase (deacetylating) [Aquabacter sp. P-9]MDE1567403.1 precorrin-6A synthase (deacetylating) [Aquabacter sp. P-9]
MTPLDDARQVELMLIGIGTGDPDHLTLGAVKALKSADLILVPLKGRQKADLADVRRAILAEHVTDPAVRIAEFQMPVRDAAGDYRDGVERWHDAIADAWRREMEAGLQGRGGRVALLVWGDPSLYDSTLRIAERLSALMPLRVTVVPGLTSMQLLTAAHCLPLNEIGASVLITTGRQLRTAGWPECSDTLVVMLDGETSFQTLQPEGVEIWWGAYLGLPQQMLLAGPLAEMAPRIVAERRAARERNGWIMDIYLLRRSGRAHQANGGEQGGA